MKSTTPKVIIEDRVRFSKSDITFRKEYKPEKKGGFSGESGIGGPVPKELVDCKIHFLAAVMP